MNNEIHNNIKESEKILQNINTTDTLEFSKWTKEKINLRYNAQLPIFPIYNNFIYWCNLGINIGRVISKLRLTNPYRKNGNLVTISQNDWRNINSQLETLYRLRPLKNE